jgi:anti-sigma B factor antagonist
MSDTPEKPAPFTVERTADGDALVARAQVKMVDDEALKTLIRHIDEASGASAPAGVQLVVLELSKVTILPSMALGLLVQIANKCKAREQRLRLAGVPPQVRQVFSITRLDRVFQFADSVDAALAQR